MNKIFIYLLSLVALSVSFASCSDWTDDESVGFESNKVDETNPALYEKYLENVRNYKNSEHKVVYTWFDNSTKQPVSKAHHISSVPDSVDYIVMLHPNNLLAWELKDIEVVRKKGTKLLISFDFDKTKSEYDETIASMVNAGEDISQMPPFMTVLSDSVDHAFKIIKKYDYDGLIIGYKGKAILHMTPEEKAEFTKYQETFISMTSIWKENNKNKILTFMGKPQNIIDKTVLASYQHIILPTQSSVNLSQVVFQTKSALDENVPTNKFVAIAETKSLDKSDKKTGMWTDGQTAIQGISDWAVSTHVDYTVAGIGIYNVSRDYYYNAGTTYSSSRSAIQTLNPSLKK